MSSERTSLEFHLHFEGEGARDHHVPAAALVQAIQALQRSIQLLALGYEGSEPKQRLRISHEMENKYAVVFGVPQDGGYDLPYTVGNAARKLFDPQDVVKVVEQHQAVLMAVETGNMQLLRRTVPSASLRRMIVSELKRMQPPARTGLVVSIEDHRRQKLLDGRTATERFAPMLAEVPVPSVMPRLVTGRLDAMEFQSRSLRLQLPSGRMLEGTYIEDFEPVLVENRREWIQVRGEAVLNEDNTLKSLNSITEIIEVDVSNINVEAVIVDGRTFAAQLPISFPVEFSPEDSMYMATGAFNMLAAAETREDVEASVLDALVFLWREYVENDSAGLSSDAVELRAELVKTFAEVKHAG